MHERMKFAVAGATGRVGHHVVEVLEERGFDVVRISRATGVDVITRDGLADALNGVDCVIDAATSPSPDQATATEFFATAARNLHEVGSAAGVGRIVVVSIIGSDRFTAGYGVATLAHEQATLAGPIPARVLRAAQFHELVRQLVDWGRQGDVSYVQMMRAQPVAARTVAEALADLAADPDSQPGDPIPEIAGPREEDMVELARALVARRGDSVRIEATSDPADPDREVYEGGGLLPSAHAILAGLTFAEWLDATPAAG